MKIHKDTRISEDIHIQSTNKLNYLTELEVLERYKKTKDQLYLNELFSRHNSMFKNIASKFYSKNPSFFSYEDYLQNAYLGAMIAYGRFSSDKSSAAHSKLSTFVYTTVYRYLQTCLDEQGAVKCPSGLREVRSYFAGKYDFDNQKKNDFEKKYSIYDDQSRNSVFTKYELLRKDAVTNFINFETDESEENFLEQNLSSVIDPDSIINSVAVSIAIESLSTVQKEVLNLKYIQNQSVKDVAETLSEKFGRKYTTSMIYNEINEIKEVFSAFA